MPKYNIWIKKENDEWWKNSTHSKWINESIKRQLRKDSPGDQPETKEWWEED